MISIQVRKFSLAFLLGVTSLVLGCSKGGELPEGDTGTVSGTVTYNGKAVGEGFNVIFMNAEKGLTANGVTNASGEYSLTMRNGSDVLVGKYLVGVTPPVKDSGKTPEQIMQESQNPSAQKPAEKPPIPAKYLSPEQSGLSFDVAKGENKIDIPLKD